jgi:hypothetical protein
MNRFDILKKRQAKLKEDVSARLDSFLIGTVAKSPSMKGHNLTTKIAGKTATLYGDEQTLQNTLEASAGSFQGQLGTAQRGKEVAWLICMILNVRTKTHALTWIGFPPRGFWGSIDGLKTHTMSICESSTDFMTS